MGLVRVGHSCSPLLTSLSVILGKVRLWTRGRGNRKKFCPLSGREAHYRRIAKKIRKVTSKPKWQNVTRKNNQDPYRTANTKQHKIPYSYKITIQSSEVVFRMPNLQQCGPPKAITSMRNNPVGSNLQEKSVAGHLQLSNRRFLCKCHKSMR